MIKKQTKPYIIEAICALILVLFVLSTYVMTSSLKVAEEKKNDDLLYVSYEVLTDNIVTVLKEEQSSSQVMIKPYTDQTVTIAKSFYNYQEDEEKQADAITYYENTYIQNTGVDYKNEANTVFSVVSILDGKVVSVTEDDITGKTIKIDHGNNVYSIYQSMSEVNVKEEDKVAQGQEIGKSGENKMNSDLKNHLHFELFMKNQYQNPEEFYGKTIGE